LTFSGLSCQNLERGYFVFPSGERAGRSNPDQTKGLTVPEAEAISSELSLKAA